MRLVHTDCNGDLHDVYVGYQFGHGPDTLEVVAMPKPHKASSQGKVNAVKRINDEELEFGIEYYASVYDMKWVEREDQGWIHPDVEMRLVFEAYDSIFGVDLSGLNLDDAIAFIRSTTIASFPDNRLDDMMLIKRWLDKQ